MRLWTPNIRMICALMVALLAGCAKEAERQPPAETVWPAGDAQAGRRTFVRLGCAHCHQVFGDDELPKPEADPPVPVVLGGAKSRTLPRASLVTAIVNPSHEIAPGFEERAVKSGHRSRMRDYGDVMTVTELVDVLAYLESVRGWSKLGGD
jgi:mono/diheme cytochrome c family protein